MHRIDGAGHVNNRFVSEDPDTNRPPTEFTAEWFNAFQEELATFIEWAGIILDKEDNTQLKQALLAKFAGLDAAATKAGVQSQAYTAFTTGGVAGAFTLTPVPAIGAYAAGQRFRVKFHAAAAGADTLAISGLAAKNIKQYDSAGAKVAAVIAVGQLADVEYDGVDFVLIDPLPPPASIGIGYMMVRDEKASGQHAGASVIGIQTRALNTVSANTISGASLASNQITLPAGTYRVRAQAPAFVNSTKGFLYNVTDAVNQLIGVNYNGVTGATGDQAQSTALVEGRFSIASAKVFELRQYCSEATASDGLGAACSQGTEVYSTVEIIKEA